MRHPGGGTVPPPDFTCSTRAPTRSKMQTTLRLVSLLTLLSASPLLAQEEGGSLLDVNVGLMFWTVLIFVIVLLVLGKFAYPPMLGAVEAREARIREMLEAAERDRAEAEALLAERRAELEQTRTQAQELLAEGRSAAEHLREQMLADTRGEQDALLARARHDIEQERERAVSQVRREAVEVAMAAAEKVIGRNLAADDNRRLVLGYIDELESGARVPSGV